MDVIREVVSGKKNRYKKDQYNLDLTYITKRIIAMSFPGEGLSGFYRNPIDQVSQFLNDSHKENYQILNLCGKKYNYDKFLCKVNDEFVWDDHHSPSVATLFKAVASIHQFLTSNIKNVVVIHCLAGKGRTGTVICCYLLLTRRFKSVEDVLQYYSKKRFIVEGLGVNQPCQLRYIYYFSKLLNSKQKLFPQLLQLKSIKFVQRPAFNYSGGCKPYFIVSNAREESQIQKQKTDNQPYNQTKAHSFKNTQQSYEMKCDALFMVYGDVLINFYNISMLSSNERMFRLSFNTAFYEDTLIDNHTLKIVFSKNDLDPSQIAKDTRFPQNFQVEIELIGCPKCLQNPQLREECECWPHLSNEVEDWKLVYDFLEKYNVVSRQQGIELLFGDESLDDVEDILERESQEEINSRVKSTSFSFKMTQIDEHKQLLI